MDLQRFGDLQPNRQDMIERCHRLLKDQRDFATAHLLIFQFEQITPLERDPPAHVRRLAR